MKFSFLTIFGGGASWTMFLLAQRRLTGPDARRAGALKGPYVAVVVFFVSVQNIAPQIDRIDLFLAGVKFSHV